jgi:hypothetical protein
MPAGVPGGRAADAGPDAVATCEAACVALHRAGDAVGEATVRLEIARLLLGQGAAAPALEQAARAAALLDRAGTPVARADAAVGVGEALAALGEADAALEVLARARPALPDGPGRGRALVARAGALAILGRDPLPDLAAAAEAFARCGHRPGLLGVLRRTAEALRRAAEAATAEPAAPGAAVPTVPTVPTVPAPAAPGPAAGTPSDPLRSRAAALATYRPRSR